MFTGPAAGRGRQPRRSRRTMHSVLAVDPEPAEPYAVRGQVYYHLGRVREAAADLAAAIDRGYRHAEAYFLRGVALDAAGQTEQALADCSMRCTSTHNTPERTIAAALSSIDSIGSMKRWETSLKRYAWCRSGFCPM